MIEVAEGGVVLLPNVEHQALGVVQVIGRWLSALDEVDGLVRRQCDATGDEVVTVGRSWVGNDACEHACSFVGWLFSPLQYLSPDQ